MKKFKLFFAVIAVIYILNACHGHSKANVLGIVEPTTLSLLPIYQWNEITPVADFSKSYNFQLFSLHDTLWAFHPDGNWFSVNGKNWTKSELINSINNLAFLDYIVFKDAVYGLGHFEGNIEKFTLTSEIYKTNNLKNWTVFAKASNLPRRFFYHPFVFKNKIWIVGGSDGNNSFADVWSSDDGVDWLKKADNMPFGKRDGSHFVIYHDRVYMINNDVWSSADGINWVQETKELVKGETVYGSAVIVFDDKIWLLGCNRNAKFKSEILVSDDGKQWKAERAPWSPRGGIAACIFNNQIFMTEGKYGGLDIAGQT
ncbi:Kelch repeat-containing protein [Ferruginibacter sp.]